MPSASWPGYGGSGGGGAGGDGATNITIDDVHSTIIEGTANAIKSESLVGDTWTYVAGTSTATYNGVNDGLPGHYIPLLDLIPGLTGNVTEYVFRITLEVLTLTDGGLDFGPCVGIYSGKTTPNISGCAQALYSQAIGNRHMSVLGSSVTQSFDSVGLTCDAIAMTQQWTEDDSQIMQCARRAGPGGAWTAEREFEGALVALSSLDLADVYIFVGAFKFAGGSAEDESTSFKVHLDVVKLGDVIS